jgi:hypothetical protein
MCVGRVRVCQFNGDVVKVSGQFVFVAFSIVCAYAGGAIALSLHVLDDSDLKVYEKFLAVSFMLGTLTYFCYVFYRFCKKL